MSDEKTYPDCYLHVREAVSGEEWIRPLTGNTKLNLKRLVKRWIKEEFCGEYFLDGELMPHLDGQFYAQIITDNRPPDSHVCWESGGFYIKDDPQPTRR